MLYFQDYYVTVNYFKSGCDREGSDVYQRELLKCRKSRKWNSRLFFITL